METFAKMFREVWEWIREDPRVMIHPGTDHVKGVILSRTEHYVSFESGNMDYFRSYAKSDWQ